MTTPSQFLPSGEYYVCDPCYVVPESEWSNFCDQLFSQDGEIFQIEIQNHNIQCQNTANGDGSYHDEQTSNVYHVDAGLIGATPVAIQDKKLNQNTFNFPEPFLVLYNNDTKEGRIEFVGKSGKTYLSIITDENEEEYDEDDDYNF